MLYSTQRADFKFRRVECAPYVARPVSRCDAPGGGPDSNPHPAATDSESEQAQWHCQVPLSLRLHCQVPLRLLGLAIARSSR